MKNYLLALGLLAGIVISVSGVEAHYAPYGSYLHSRIHKTFSGPTDGTPDHGYPPVEQLQAKTYHNSSYDGASQTRYEEILLTPFGPTGGMGRNVPGGRPWSSNGSN